MKPLVVELFAGCCTWSAGWLSLGGQALCFDIEHLPHHGPVPEGAQLVLQDVLTLDGAQFKDASLILASPPCQAYSYRAMPWKRAKALPPPDNTLFEACFRIQREASTAAGRHIPMVVENVCGAQKWVGRARWHHGSFYLWGDVPALMPVTFSNKGLGGRNKYRNSNGQLVTPRLTNAAELGASESDPRAFQRQSDGKFGAVKVPSFRFDGSGKSFQSASVATMEGGLKLPGNNSEILWKDRPIQRLKDATKGADGGCFNDKKRQGNGDATGYLSRTSGRSNARKAASAAIARIPYPLSLHIARCYYPHD